MATQKIVCPECSTVNTIKEGVVNESIPCTNCKEALDDPFPLEVTDEVCKIHIAENDIPILVDFYSTTCGPCMAMYDDYEDAALGFALKVRFLKINADVHQEVARDYKVRGLPTIIAFKNGQEVNRLSEQLSHTQLSIWAQSLVDLEE